jgi:hypothetical protein
LPQGYLEKEAQVNSSLSKLHEEIFNPNGGKYCGIGKDAELYIGEITNIYPKFHKLDGSGPIYPCDTGKEERIYKAYEKMALDLLHNDPEFVESHVKDKVEFREQLGGNYKKIILDNSLGKLEESAAGLGSAESLDKGPLYDAFAAYNADHATYLSLTSQPAQTDLEPQSNDVNSYAKALRLFIRRLDNAMSWFYLILAFGIDFAVIYLITQLNVRFRHKNYTYTEHDRVFETDPKYIWAALPKTQFSSTVEPD